MRTLPELYAERRRLGVDAACAADADGVDELARTHGQRVRVFVRAGEHNRACSFQLESKRRIEHVARRQPVAKLPAASPIDSATTSTNAATSRLVDLLPLVDGLDRKVAFARICSMSAAGTIPASASASQTASSTSSHDWSFAPAVQTAPISGRV